jgi:heterodisulfide reductase subunit B2
MKKQGNETSYAFFPGCSLESTAWDYHRSTSAVLRALGIRFEELENWVCCGSTPAHASDSDLAAALPVLNLQKAKEMGLPLMAACASCYSRFRIANHNVAQNAGVRDRVASLTGASYNGEVPVRHVMDVVVNDVGLKGVAKRIRRSLNGLKVACYYGCLLTRPREIVAFDDPENPTCMDDLIATLGGTPVSWPYKTECCGASHSIPNPDLTARLSHRILDMAEKAGADCVAVACQMCQMNLDLGQSAAGKVGALQDIPVLYITQLLGLALGQTPEEVGLRALIVGADALLAKMNMDKAS